MGEKRNVQMVWASFYMHNNTVPSGRITASSYVVGPGRSWNDIAVSKHHLDI